MPKAATEQHAQVLSIKALTPDPRNARKRTERSHALIEKSLSTYGAARSIVIDEMGTILAGNGTVEAAANIGIDKVLVVPVDGNTLVAVQRTDLTPKQKAEYSIADNRASDLSEFDAATLTDIIDEIPDLDIGSFFTDEEFQALLERDGVGVEDQEPEQPKAKAMEVKLKFENQDDFDTFLQTIAQLSAVLPKHKTTEARLQFILDEYISGLNS